MLGGAGGGADLDGGALELRGRAVQVRAIVNDAMPQALSQVRLKGRKLEDAALRRALEKHFTLAEGFGGENTQRVDDYFVSQWADGYSAAAGCDDRLIAEQELEAILPGESDAPQEWYDQYAAFLTELGIVPAKNTGYICRQTQRTGECVAALIPYEIQGLSTEYRHHLAHRDSLACESPTGQHIMDYPWAAFVFDRQGRLAKLELFTCEVASSKPLEGTPVSWKEAAESALAAVIAETVDQQRTLAGRTDYSEESFWQETLAQLSLATPMWAPNWNNECTPCWLVRYQLYGADTGALLRAASIAVDAATGKAAHAFGGEQVRREGLAFPGPLRYDDYSIKP